MHFAVEIQCGQTSCGIQQPIVLGILIISENIYKRIMNPLKTSIAQVIVEDV